MGSCRYCGRGAGWFRTSHRGCRYAHGIGLARMVDLVAWAAERPEFTQRGGGHGSGCNILASFVADRTSALGEAIFT